MAVDLNAGTGSLGTFVDDVLHLFDIRARCADDLKYMCQYARAIQVTDRQQR